MDWRRVPLGSRKHAGVPFPKPAGQIWPAGWPAGPQNRPLFQATPISPRPQKSVAHHRQAPWSAPGALGNTQGSHFPNRPVRFDRPVDRPVPKIDPLFWRPPSTPDPTKLFPITVQCLWMHRGVSGTAGSRALIWPYQCTESREYRQHSLKSCRLGLTRYWKKINGRNTFWSLTFLLFNIFIRKLLHSKGLVA